MGLLKDNMKIILIIIIHQIEKQTDKTCLLKHEETLTVIIWFQQ